MKKAVFPGTFDPPTLGHLNLIQRASDLFDEVVILVAVNPDKRVLFSVEERVSLLEGMVKEIPHVHVDFYSGLIVDYCKDNGVKAIIRGIRSGTDFHYEYDLAMINKRVNPEVETVFLPADGDSSALRSSFVKELYKFKADISEMVTKEVAEAMDKKLNIY